LFFMFIGEETERWILEGHFSSRDNKEERKKTMRIPFEKTPNTCRAVDLHALQSDPLQSRPRHLPIFHHCVVFSLPAAYTQHGPDGTPHPFPEFFFFRDRETLNEYFPPFLLPSLSCRPRREPLSFFGPFCFFLLVPLFFSHNGPKCAVWPLLFPLGFEPRPSSTDVRQPFF